MKSDFGRNAQVIQRLFLPNPDPGGGGKFGIGMEKEEYTEMWSRRKALESPGRGASGLPVSCLWRRYTEEILD